MKRLLIAGATGNIGQAVIRHLCTSVVGAEIVAAVRDVERGAKKLPGHERLSFVHFDFEDTNSFEAAFEGIDILFLLRPPHISKVEVVFEPLLAAAKNCGIGRVVFLSVQGAEKSKVIPHYKIEKLIESMGFEFIFIRPGYFMQNLTTTLRPELVEKHTLTLPSGNAKFNWIDVDNIGEVTAALLIQFEDHRNRAYEITGSENISFPQVVEVMREVTGIPFEFRSINPVSFYFKKKKAGLTSGFSLVMTILHFLPRLQAEPKISEYYQKLTGKSPTTLRQFIERERDLLSN